MTIQPLGDRILVQQLDAVAVTPGGIIIPDNAQEKPQEGTVIAVGPGSWDKNGNNRIPLDIAEGDTVVYGKYAATTIIDNGTEYLIVPAKDVLAVIPA
ncbi:co-chaperone GroES [Mycolicibacterium sphagni]|uniref:co-chaperone GroES n=1 Tax=Mycolicibacterium sphagni TaxID=1786 RepID=UPI0021F2A05B|nr:co-chaperone GroES [Mycolicibacterium sphagni]MCV7174916.1 co-chaperone GroES [Mycolicibacterium sphagni]